MILKNNKKCITSRKKKFITKRLNDIHEDGQIKNFNFVIFLHFKF